MEKGYPEGVLECANLVAHRAVRHIQLGGRF